MDTLALIQQQIAENPVLLYMKGTPDFPQCGFSARAAAILQQLNVAFAHVNILENPEIRKTLPEYAKWPTFPQLWIQGELFGGSDIMLEAYESGELATALASVSTKESIQ